MACCLCFFQGSKTTCIIIRIIAFLAPVLSSALFASSSSSSLLGVLLMILLLSTTLFLFTFSKQKPVILYSSLLKENEQENTRADHCSSDDELVLLPQTEIADSTAARKKGSAEAESDVDRGLILIRSQDFSESSANNVDQYYSSTSSSNTSTSSGEEDQLDEDQYSSSDHSTAEWPNLYNSTMMGERKLDDSISDDDDEESLIEIAIQSGHFVSPDQHYSFFDDSNNLLKCCKVVSAADGKFPMFHHKDFLADNMMNEMMNEEDNLIEIDIYMGSIKCSTF